MEDDITKKLYLLFEEEQLALLQSKYHTLDAIAARKEQYLTVLSDYSVSQAVLTDIKNKLMENQKLISAALGGVAAAHERLTALAAVRDGLTTYDPSGRVESITTAPHRFEKKS